MTFLKKILLVDYEPRVTALIRAALEKTGKYVIKEEHNSKLAIHAARFFQPDVILFDSLMTRHDGEDVAQQLQSDPSFKETPVVFVSVNTTPQDGVISSGILSGYSFLANPVRVEDVVRYVGELMKPAPKAKVTCTAA